MQTHKPDPPLRWGQMTDDPVCAERWAAVAWSGVLPPPKREFGRRRPQLWRGAGLRGVAGPARAPPPLVLPPCALQDGAARSCVPLCEHQTLCKAQASRPSSLPRPVMRGGLLPELGPLCSCVTLSVILLSKAPFPPQNTGIIVVPVQIPKSLPVFQRQFQSQMPEKQTVTTAHLMVS